MRVMLEIPDEFIDHFERDRFYESLTRFILDTHMFAGEYDTDVLYMIREQLQSAKM